MIQKVFLALRGTDLQLWLSLSGNNALIIQIPEVLDSYSELDYQ